MKLKFSISSNVLIFFLGDYYGILFNTLVDALILCLIENGDESSANNLEFEEKLPDKSLI